MHVLKGSCFTFPHKKSLYIGYNILIYEDIYKCLMLYEKGFQS